MKKVFIAVLIIILMPLIVVADNNCLEEGYSIVYVNGIFTEEEKAEEDRRLLIEKMAIFSNLGNTNVILGYNPSHLAGAGDLLQAVSQALMRPVNTFDKNTILLSIHDKVKTQKILLLGHSQGTFYTNELYEYLVHNGVPEDSLFVFNIATPASHVAGGGKYLTSANDNTILKIREVSASADAPEPLSANILIPLQEPDAPALWRGHSFGKEYLGGAAFDIISTIENVLETLSVHESSTAEKGCFNPPERGLAYSFSKASFGVLDSLANKGVEGGKVVARAISSTANTFAQSYSAFKNIFAKNSSPQQASVIEAISDEPAINEEVVTIVEEEPLNIPPIPEVSTALEDEPIFVEENIVIKEDAQEEVVEVALVEEVEVEESEAGTPSSEGAPSFIIPVPMVPGFGGGMPPPTRASSSTFDSAPVEDTPAEDTPLVIDPPTAPAITSPLSGQHFGTTTITFTGTTTPEKKVYTDMTSASTTADTLGDWSLSLDSFSQGTTTIGFWVEEEGVRSATSTIELFIDSIAPEITALSIEACSYSLSSSGCLLPIDTVLLSWTNSSSDVLYFAIEKGGSVIATTTESTYTLSLVEGSQSVRIGAYDALGNSATSSESNITRVENALVINEIAWAGTEASSFDEWIELYNPSSHTLDLSHVVLHGEDLVPYLTLSGSIAPGAFYLLERGEDGTTTDVVEDKAIAFSGVGGGSGLANTGEVLMLSLFTGSATTTLDFTPLPSECGGGWCGGVAGATPRSMERVSTSVAGNVPSNWKSNNTFTTNGSDADSNAIVGTPKARNSVNLLSVGFYCGPYSSTFVDGGYYEPTETYCYYTSEGFSGVRFGGLYKGEVASSTLINSHSLGSGPGPSTQFGYDFSLFVDGEKYFTAIYERGTGAVGDITAFNTFFLSGDNPPPTLNYGVIEWTYGAMP